MLLVIFAVAMATCSRTHHSAKPFAAVIRERSRCHAVRPGGSQRGSQDRWWFSYPSLLFTRNAFAIFRRNCRGSHRK
jgi:hypothetical protein